MGEPRERPAQGEAIREPMCVGYARECQISEQLQLADENGILRRINRAIIYYLGAYCCNLDLRAGQPEEPPLAPPSESDWAPLAQCPSRLLCASESVKTPIARGAQARRAFGLAQSQWKRQLRFGWIPQLVLVCYLTFVAYLLVALYHQYSYDFDLLRLRRLRELRQEAANASLASASMATAEVELNARMSDTKATLELLGPDYSHLSILVECFYLSIVIFVTVIYLFCFIYYRFRRPFDYHMIRDLFDRQRENGNVQRLVERQVAKFIESGRVFQKNLVSFHSGRVGEFRETGLDAHSSAGASLKLAGEAQCASATFRREHELTRVVREMLASGALTPLYKTRAWIERRTKLQFACHTALLIYAIAFDVCLTVAFYAGTDPARSTGASRAPFVQVACLGLLAIAGPSVAVHAPLFIVVVLEQLNYVQQLRAMTKRCILENSRAEEELARASGRTGLTAQERTMNSNLIFLLLHYKIFVAQLLPIKRPVGFVNIIALLLLFTMPLIARIHEPYLSELNEGGRLSGAQHKIFTILISSSILVPANLTIGPLCRMFARCEDLYRDLASLMAHISGVKLRSKSSGRANIYDSHAESCLMKELADSRRMLEQLTVRAAGIAGTYTVLMRVHFWYGLLAISIMVDTNYGQNNNNNNNNGGGGDLLSSLFSDPLGVYS